MTLPRAEDAAGATRDSRDRTRVKTLAPQPLCGPCMAAKVVFPGSNKSFSGALTRTFGHAKTAAAVIPRPDTPQL